METINKLINADPYGNLKRVIKIVANRDNLKFNIYEYNLFYENRHNIDNISIKKYKANKIKDEDLNICLFIWLLIKNHTLSEYEIELAYQLCNDNMQKSLLIHLLYVKCLNVKLIIKYGIPLGYTEHIDINCELYELCGFKVDYSSINHDESLMINRMIRLNNRKDFEKFANNNLNFKYLTIAAARKLKINQSFIIPNISHFIEYIDELKLYIRDKYGFVWVLINIMNENIINYIPHIKKLLDEQFDMLIDDMYRTMHRLFVHFAKHHNTDSEKYIKMYNKKLRKFLPIKTN